METIFSRIIKTTIMIMIIVFVGSYIVGNMLQPLMDEHDRVVRPYDLELERFQKEENDAVNYFE